MRRKIYLHGSLRSIHKGPIEVVADTVAEAIRLVTTQLPGFKPNAVTGYRRVAVVGCDTVESLFEQGPADIHLVPQLNGGKQGGFFQIVIGAVLIAAAVLTMGTSLAFMSTFLMSAGISLMLGGILQLLQQPPRGDTNSTTKSHYLSNAQNTVAIGTPIAIPCGRNRAGGQFLSINIEAIAI